MKTKIDTLIDQIENETVECTVCHNIINYKDMGTTYNTYKYFKERYGKKFMCIQCIDNIMKGVNEKENKNV